MPPFLATLEAICLQGQFKLFDWNDENGPATDIVTNIANIDVEGSIATARLESDNWTGCQSTPNFCHHQQRRISSIKKYKFI